MTLQAFLDLNIKYLHEAVKTVEPGGDLQPIVVFESPKGLNIIVLKLADKDAELRAVRQILREQGATQYASIMAAWTVALDGLALEDAKRVSAFINDYGTGHPLVEPLRRECYMVTVGDRDGSLYAQFLVERDATGRISKLDRQANPPGLFSGRMTDLLAEARH